MKPFVNITIAAPTGVGKSTIAQVIYNALNEAGFDVAISDLDVMNFTEARVSTLQQRVDAIKVRIPIVIQTEALNRSALNRGALPHIAQPVFRKPRPV